MDLSASDIRIIVIVFDVCLLFVCVCRKTTYYFTCAAVHAILTILWMRIITSVNRNKTLVASLWVFMNSIFILFWAAGGCTCPTRSARKRTPQRAGRPSREAASRFGWDPRTSWDATPAVSLHSLATPCPGRRRLQSSGRFSVRQSDGEDGWVCKASFLQL